jgi:hypothetical protein
MKELEEGSELQLDFTKLQKVAKTGLPVLPVVVQDADSRKCSSWPTRTRRRWSIR